MSVAVLIAGQLRSSRGYAALVNDLIKPLNADVYLATWTSTGLNEALEILQPVEYNVFNPDMFPVLKQAFWEDYKVLQSNLYVRNSRFALLNGQIQLEKYDECRLDNTIRMFFLNSMAIDLVRDKYDLLVKARPDLRMLNRISNSVWPTDAICCPKTQYRDDSKGKYTGDQFFYGAQLAMTKAMSFWDNMAQFAAQIEDKYVPINSSAWLSPEASFKRYIELYCHSSIYPDDCKVRVLRYLESEKELALANCWDANFVKNVKIDK